MEEKKRKIYYSAPSPSKTCEKSFMLRPISPETVLNKFNQKLSSFEHKEILKYPEIWFLGLDSQKLSGESGISKNFGRCACYFIDGKESKKMQLTPFILLHKSLLN